MERTSGTDGLLGMPLDPGGLVDYQPGAVVSRTIIDRKAGTLTIFAFAQGQGLSEHTAPFDATIAVLEGKAEITIDAQPRIVKAGEWIIMPANHPHAVKAFEPFKMALIMVRE